MIEAAVFIESSNENENYCSICYTELDNNNKYTLECNHSFHIDCTILWFRRGNSTCPLCRDVNTNDIEGSFCNSCPNIYKCIMTKRNWQYARFTYMKSVINNSNAPKDLIKRFNKYNKINQKLKDFIRINSEWRRSNEYKIYKKSRDKTIKLNYKIYDIRKKINKVKMEICSYPLIPYRFIPNKDVIKTPQIKKYNTRSQSRNI